MKTSFITFAVVLLGTCLDLTTAAACDKTTRVDRCDNQECTYQNFNVSHVPDPRSKSPISCSKDTKWDYYSFSCAKPEDPSKCEGIKQEDECVASQCAWHAYYEKKYKSDEYKTFTFCLEKVECSDVWKNKDVCDELDNCKFDDEWGCIYK